MEKKDKFLIAYYVVLLALYILMAYQSIDVGSIFRFGYLLCIVGPLYAWKINWVPAVTTVFYSVATANYSTTILPVDPRTYLVFLLIGLIISMQKRKQAISWPLIVIAILTFMTNFVTEGKIEDVTFSIIWLITFFFYSSFEDKQQIAIFSYSFLVISFVISISRIFMGEAFTEVYAGGLERSALQDINYSACVVGMGIVAGANLIFRKSISGIVPILFVVITILLSLFTLAANASRASILGVAVAVAILLLFSKIKMFYKLLILGAIAGVIVYMYNNSYFDLLQYRIENDEGGGSNRLLIWPRKIQAFFDEGNVLNYFFGLGYEYARGMGDGSAFHNDFLAYFCEYGFIGGIAFLWLYIIPFKRCGLRNAECLASLLYLAIVCFTLEPFAAGRIPYFAFWFYIMILASNNTNQQLYSSTL